MHASTVGPVYLVVHLDRTLCYKTHIEKTRMKVNARNNIIRKLANSKWGWGARHQHSDPTVSPSATQLSNAPALFGQGLYMRASWTRPYTTAAESSRAASNQRTWTVYTYWPVSPLLTSGGLLPAAWNVHDKRQTPDTRHQLFHHRPAASRLKSRKSFMCTVTPLDLSASSSRLWLWKDSLTDVPASVNMGVEVAESLPAGSGEDWLCWRSLNRLRTGVGRAKTVMRRWDYLDDAQSVDYDCGEPQTMARLLSCRLLDEACTADNLATVTEPAKACARKWENIVWRTRQKKKKSVPHIAYVVIIVTSRPRSLWETPPMLCISRELRHAMGRFYWNLQKVVQRLENVEFS